MDIIGIYIDSDNISHKIMPNIYDYIKGFGNIGLFKVYRDWSQEDSKKWIDVVNKYKLEAVQCFRQPKKQSTDVHMITDIYNDIMNIKNLHTIVLATCDSDYLHLYQQIMKMGKQLIIIGKDKNFCNICHHFIYYNDLLPNNINGNEDSISEKALENFVNNIDLSNNDSMNKDELLKYLICGMNKKNIISISEFKKNLKELNYPSNTKPKWRKMENELEKFPDNFLIINKKNRILVLYLPDILSKKFSKEKIQQIILTKYSDLLAEISIDQLMKYFN